MNTFEPYTWQHVLPILFFFVTGFIAVRIGRNAPDTVKQSLGLGIATLVLLFMLGGSIIKFFNGTWSPQEDLPLFLCRTIAWMLPVVMLFQSRFWLGVFYFWILAGTLQGLVTPDLTEGFPSYFYFRYWFLHAGLVAAIIYAVIVFRVRITWRDFWRAILLAQVYLVLVHGINAVIGSNYSYTMRKPPGHSILDFFGSWPWYILGGELIMIVLFLLLMLPWTVRKSETVAGLHAVKVKE